MIKKVVIPKNGKKKKAQVVAIVLSDVAKAIKSKYLKKSKMKRGK